MTELQNVVTKIGKVRDHTARVAKEVTDIWPIYFVWGMGSSGEHKQGRALDFMTYELGGGVDAPGRIRNQLGWNIANYLWKNRERLGVWYVIYSGQIISINNNDYGPAGGWNNYGDHGSATANHMDHVHVSFLDKPPVYKPSAVGDWFDMAEKADLQDVVFHTKVIPNKNEPGGKQEGMLTLAKFATNVEATQDEHSKRLASLERKLDEILTFLKAA